MSDYVIPEIKATEAEMISIRHYLHANPELSLEEFNTSELVAGKLAEWGYQVTRGLGKTGVVGSLRKGDSPRTMACAPIWTRCRSMKRLICPGPVRYPEKCTPAAMTAIPPFACGGEIYRLAGLPV